ncbi:MAG: hypothetical protein RL125_9 [Actinomycetota bacterium]
MYRGLTLFFGSKRNLGLSVLAVALLFLCLVAGNWQYERGVERRIENQVIRANFERPVIDLPLELRGDRSLYQGRMLRITGQFLAKEEILMRNRYFQDQYGFGVATLFQLTDGRFVWIDRGWVKAGSSATEVPKIQAVPARTLTLLVRYRDDALDAKIRGSFFATGKGQSQLARWNDEISVASEDFYFDLIGGDFEPLFPTPAPLVSDGPHLAYAIQWWFFGALVLLGRGLIAREDWRASQEQTN